MLRGWLALAVLCSGAASGAGPNYSAASIVNASDYSPGPFAPNSVLSIFGSGLARSTYALAASDIVAGQMPHELNYVRVYVQDQPVSLLFVSDGQINFIMSSVLTTGPVRVRVVTEGVSGPEIVLTLVDAAPALFSRSGGYAIATSADGKLLTADSPGHAGDTIVVYATGLGRTSPNPGVYDIPNFVAPIVALSSLKVTLGDKAVDPGLIKYAGLTPGSAGLYQVNLVVPEGTGDDPEIQISAAGSAPTTGLKMPIR
ncbi:MAG TPA: hypothetical protein VMH28_32810 [Candidatus Acidoferrales bacterium]|nr:hypothetical protein [Candidatus Acidoferrales bacterium]